MKRFDFNELIEKAFCLGYEEAQKEFARKDYEGLTKRQKEALRQRRRDYAKSLNEKRNSFRDQLEDFDWENPEAFNSISSKSGVAGGGVKSTITTETSRGGRTGKAYKDLHKKTHLGEMLNQSERASKLMRENVEKEVKPGRAAKGRDYYTNKDLNLIGKIKGESKKWDRDNKVRDRYSKHDDKFFDEIKESNFRNNEKLNEKLKNFKERKQAEKEYAGLFDKIEAKERLENIKKIRTSKNLKKAGLALAGTAAAAGVAYGAKKLYDKRKKAKEAEKEQNKKAED